VIVLLALAAGYGVFLVYTSVVLGWKGLGPRPARPAGPRRRMRSWLAQAGLDEVQPLEFGAVLVLLMVAGSVTGLLLFGGPLPAMACGVLVAALPVTAYRARRERRREEARSAWPRIIEEIRVLTGSVGLPIPQALFEAGRRSPEDLHRAFAAAEREWLVSTDFARTLSDLRERLGDPGADAICETLLVAYEVGGPNLDRRLAALAEDRVQELQGRKDAQARQAGVRFARRFVLLVPLGMALAGLSIGTGRAAYETPIGQVTVAVGVVATLACWLWAGRLMRLPETERVFR
jgi:tight adherence protein B